MVGATVAHENVNIIDAEAILCSRLRHVEQGCIPLLPFDIVLRINHFTVHRGIRRTMSTKKRRDEKVALNFSGRVALVAGAGGGIGLNIAGDLLAAGLDVVLADCKPESPDIDRGLGSACFLQGDLTDEKFVIELVETVSAASTTWLIRPVCSGLIKIPRLQLSISTCGIEYLKSISNRLC